MIIEEVYKEHLRFGVGAFLMPETEKEGCTGKENTGCARGAANAFGRNA